MRRALKDVGASSSRGLRRFPSRSLGFISRRDQIDFLDVANVQRGLDVCVHWIRRTAAVRLWEPSLRAAAAATAILGRDLFPGADLHPPAKLCFARGPVDATATVPESDDDIDEQPPAPLAPGQASEPRCDGGPEDDDDDGDDQKRSVGEPLRSARDVIAAMPTVSYTLPPAANRTLISDTKEDFDAVWRDRAQQIPELNFRGTTCRPLAIRLFKAFMASRGLETRPLQRGDTHYDLLRTTGTIDTFHLVSTPGGDPLTARVTVSTVQFVRSQQTRSFLNAYQGTKDKVTPDQVAAVIGLHVHVVLSQLSATLFVCVGKSSLLTKSSNVKAGPTLEEADQKFLRYYKQRKDLRCVFRSEYDAIGGLSVILRAALHREVPPALVERTVDRYGRELDSDGSLNGLDFLQSQHGKNADPEFQEDWGKYNHVHWMSSLGYGVEDLALELLLKGCEIASVRKPLRGEKMPHQHPFDFKLWFTDEEATAVEHKVTRVEPRHQKNGRFDGKFVISLTKLAADAEGSLTKADGICSLIIHRDGAVFLHFIDKATTQRLLQTAKLKSFNAHYGKRTYEWIIEAQDSTQAVRKFVDQIKHDCGIVAVSEHGWSELESWVGGEQRERFDSDDVLGRCFPARKGHRFELITFNLLAHFGKEIGYDNVRWSHTRDCDLVGVKDGRDEGIECKLAEFELLGSNNHRIVFSRIDRSKSRRKIFGVYQRGRHGEPSKLDVCIVQRDEDLFGLYSYPHGDRVGMVHKYRGPASQALYFLRAQYHSNGWQRVLSLTIETTEARNPR